MSLPHLFYIGTCYIPYAIFLFFTVLIFPALAFFPHLLRSPLFATSIPIVSIVIVDTIAIFLFKFNLYHSNEIYFVTLMLTGIALFRVFFLIYKGSYQWKWEKTDKYLMILNVGLMLPLLAFNGISGFMTDDAVRSWNYWAMHFYRGEMPDLEGYPPFFPFFISYCYQLLGTPEYQGPVKALLTIFPFTIVNAIAFVNSRMKDHWFFYLILISSCVTPGFLSFGFYRFYSSGYADPMLAATIATSLMFLIQYFQTEKSSYLGLCVLCAIAASLSKQPGMLWAGVSLPLILLVRSFWFKKWIGLECLAMLMLWIPIIIWLIAQGGHFYHNVGVISASLHPKLINETITLTDITQTLLKSIDTYFIKEPSLLLLFILAGIVSVEKRENTLIFLLFLVPATLLWFVLGSYGMRLGLYIITAWGVLIASGQYLLDTPFCCYVSQKIQSIIQISLQTLSYRFFIIGLLLFSVFSYTDQKNSHINTPYHLYPLNAGLSYSYEYFGSHANFIYKHLYNNPNIKIWVLNRYISGIFYGHTRIVPGPATLSVSDLYQNFSEFKPDYILTGFCNRQEPECEAIKELIARYPGLLIEMALGPTRYDYHLYQLNKQFFN